MHAKNFFLKFYTLITREEKQRKTKQKKSSLSRLVRYLRMEKHECVHIWKIDFLLSWFFFTVCCFVVFFSKQKFFGFIFFYAFCNRIENVVIQSGFKSCHIFFSVFKKKYSTCVSRVCLCGFCCCCVCLWNRFVFVLFVLVCVFVVFLTRPTRFAVWAAKSGTPDWRASNPSGIEGGAFVWTVPSASLPPKKKKELDALVNGLTALRNLTLNSVSFSA